MAGVSMLWQAILLFKNCYYMINVDVRVKKKDLPGGELALFPPNFATMDRDDKGKCRVKESKEICLSSIPIQMDFLNKFSQKSTTIVQNNNLCLKKVGGFTPKAIITWSNKT